jgi:hypothetical protein
MGRQPSTHYADGLVIAVWYGPASATVQDAYAALRACMQTQGAHSGSLLVPTACVSQLSDDQRLQWAREGVNIEHVAAPSEAHARQLLSEHIERGKAMARLLGSAAS